MAQSTRYTKKTIAYKFSLNFFNSIHQNLTNGIWPNHTGILETVEHTKQQESIFRHTGLKKGYATRQEIYSNFTGNIQGFHCLSNM